MITVIGKDSSGKVVASEKVDTSRDAEYVVKLLSDSGLTVEQKIEGNGKP